MRICFNDYDRELALVAILKDEHGKDTIAGVGRLIKLRGGQEAEFAVLVSDQFQHQGLGRELLARLVQYGRDEGMHRIVADILPENTGMIRVSEQLGFKITRVPDDDTLRAELVL